MLSRRRRAAFRFRRGGLALRRGDLEVAGAVGFGELADLDEAFGDGAGGGLFAGWG